MTQLLSPGLAIWALNEASKPGGFTPNAAGTVRYLTQLEDRGLVRQDGRNPVWFITEYGVVELARLEKRA